VGVVALVGLTIGLTALIGRLANGNYWIGALVVGVIELVLAYVLITRGLKQFRKPSYTLVETRESLKDTTAWVVSRRAD
jgi:drug/metabolite transporter (DMT)-like permease